MSNIEIKCLNCGEKYLLEPRNAKILGPVIHAWCPLCRKKTIRNISKFVQKQIPGANTLSRFELFSEMAIKAKQIEEKLL